jgi:phosphatidylserine decarboxylase
MSAVSYVTAQFLRVLPRARIGRAVGRLAEQPWSPAIGKAVVSLYSRAYRVPLDEYEAGHWASFDAFFTRRLRAGLRPLAPNPATVLSPADGRIESTSRIDDSCAFLVKGRPYSVEDLIGDAAEARRYAGGAGFVVYLSPRDYHRVHAPVSGTIHHIRSMPGDYFPVNPVGMRHVRNLFCRNRRVSIEIEGEGGLGRVAVVMVVAMIVGRITTIGVDAPDVPFGRHTFEEPIAVARGDELGAFHLGSTAVVLVEKFAEGSRLAGEGPVRYGQALLEPPSPSRESRR